MPYTVRSSEKLRKSGADTETKAMLYLMNIHPDRDKIYYFVVDFFNDLTGMNRTARQLWDMQSKGAKTSSPKAIGKELVTLYKNYVSEFKFKKYILFLGGVSNTVRNNNNINIFGIDNLKDSAIDKILEGLEEECRAKEYIDASDIDKVRFMTFLSEVEFVVDDKLASEYIKMIIGTHPQLIPEDDILTGIFNEIRDIQSSKKNINVVEHMTIQEMSEALDFCRHLTSSEIKLLVLQRLLNRDILGKGVPEPFVDNYSHFPAERRTDMLEQCQSACCRALFNNNCADGYWKLFEVIYQEIMENPKETVNAIYANISDDVLNGCPDFDTISFKYFIAIIKEGLQS